MNNKKFRSRCFTLLLYPDNQDHVKALEKIQKGYEYIYILHDKDTNLDGEIKKKHWHVVIRVGNNARWNTAIASELGIQTNFIQDVKNLDRMLQYLIHYNEPDKTQYPIEECKGSLVKRLELSLSKGDKSEVEKILEIMDIIESCDRYLCMSELARHCAESGTWSEFRRSATIFKEILYEHNFEYNKEI